MGREIGRGTRGSWASRLGGSLKGVVFGVILIALSAWLLFWNEGRAVRRYRALSEGQGIVVPINADRVDPANEGKLVHLSGEAATEGLLADDTFGVRVRAIQLKRSVEMYQWAESKSSRDEEKADTQSATVATYSYTPRWSSQLIDSARFHESAEHQNPAKLPVEARVTVARDVRVGAFLLPERLAARIDRFVPLDVTRTDQFAGDLRWRARLVDGAVFLGRNPSSPAIGDVKVRFEHVPLCQVSIVARQIGETFEPFRTSSGETIELLRAGAAGPEAMFEGAQSGNRINSWLLRLVGLTIMYFGVSKILRPIAVLAGIVPMVGETVAAGTRLISLLMALFISLFVVAVGWIYYRPLLAVGLLLIAAIAAVLFLLLLRKATSPTAETVTPA